MTDGPLIVQSDKTLLLEVDHPDAQACRMAIAAWAAKVVSTVVSRSPNGLTRIRQTTSTPISSPPSCIGTPSTVRSPASRCRSNRA